MKYEKLPLYVELALIDQTQGNEEMVKARNAYFLELIRCKGWQLVVGLLRDYETQAIQCLRTAKGDTDRILGIIHAIEYIRQSLTGLMPVESRHEADFHDGEQEDYLNVEDQIESVWE
jgi:hypothetical protein